MSAVQENTLTSFVALIGISRPFLVILDFLNRRINLTLLFGQRESVICPLSSLRELAGECEGAPG